MQFSSTFPLATLLLVFIFFRLAMSERERGCQREKREEEEGEREKVFIMVLNIIWFQYILTISYRVLTYPYDINPIILFDIRTDIVGMAYIANIDGRYFTILILKKISPHRYWYRYFKPWFLCLTFHLH